MLGVDIAVKNKFFQNDAMLICSMLVLYGICIIGFIVTTFVWLGQRKEATAANATATVAASVTQQANATATAIARPTEQAQYEFVDPFTENTEYWLIETTDNEYMVGSISLSGGVYVWNIQEVKQPFVYWANFYRGNRSKDFDIYVDTKIARGAPGDACSGFVFRTASVNWEEGAYTFSVCNNSSFDVNYYKRGEWESIAQWIYSDAIQNNDWNRLAISARGNHFIFTINNQVVYEMTDDRLPVGGLALLIEVNEERPVSVLFDNLGFEH